VGGGNTGGKAVGGAGTVGGSTGTGGSEATGCIANGPCSGKACPSCKAVTATNFASGNLGASAVCYEATVTINSGNCGNFVAPRTLSINGTGMACDGNGWTLPAKANGGYCFVITAGNYDYAYFNTW
jgi:hypothetical protein